MSRYLTETIDDVPYPDRMSCREAARYLRVSEKTLSRWRTDKRGPYFHRPRPGRPYYTRSDLDAWLNASKVRTYRA